MGFPRSVERKVSNFGLLVAVLAAALLVIPAGFSRASGPAGTVEGFITDSVSSNGIASAQVELTASDMPWVFQTTADVAGFYSLAVPNHRYAVRVTSASHVVNTTGIAIGSGQTVWLNMTLTPAGPRSARLQGFVTDSSSSAPVTGGRIIADSSSSYQNSSGMNASGYYEMDLVPGFYQVSTDDVIGYVPYSYSSLSLSTAQVRWFNISLTSNPLAAWLNGTVIDSNNYSPIVGATITANVDGLQLPSTGTNASGEFSLRVPSGDVQLAADAVGYAPIVTSVYIWGAGDYSTYIYLAPLAAEVHGYVRDGLTGGPIPGALVVASPFWSTGYFDQDPANASGYYELHLSADDFTVTVTAQGYTSWWSWAFLSTGDSIWANLTLWPIISTLKGYVFDATNGTPVAGLTVSVSDARSAYSTSKVSDSLGFFSFLLTPSPAITLRVFGAPPYAGAVAYPTTRPHATTWANLTLDPLVAQIQATVTDAATGLPISAATVSLSWAYGTNWGSTNASGVALVSAPAAPSLSVSAWAVGYFGWYGTLSVTSGVRSISISLNPSLPTNVTVQGYVRDAGTNAAVVSAFVQATGYDGSAPYDYTDGSGYYQLTIVARAQTVRATYYGYAAGTGSVAPSTGGAVWLNLTMARDSTVPRILDFSAIPSAGLQPSNPSTLLAHVNESSLARATISILMLRSAAGNIGTFLNLGPLDASGVFVTPTTPGNYSVSSSWDTRTAVGRFSDGVSSEYWPALSVYTPFQVAVSGYWDNATISTPAYSTAYFDSRNGNLLFVYTGYGYIGPQDQPTSTFTPYASGIRLDLTTAAIVGATLVNGFSYQLGTLHMSVSSSVPGGPYAALLETFDSAGNYANDAALLYVATDSVPPTADAGVDRIVDQGAMVTFDGSASYDNVGIANYTWTFVDGSLRVLYGVVTNYLFTNAGTFLVSLTVRDAAGNTATNTLTVTVRDVTAPNVSVTAPVENATLSGSASILATASDNLAVIRVEFLVDGISVGNVTAAPFQLALDTRRLANGSHTIMAEAFDAAGNSASATRHVTVLNTPGGPGGPPAGLDVFVWGGLVALLVAVVAAVALILARRKRPRRPIANPPPQAGVSSPPTAGTNSEARDSWEL